MSTAKRGKRRSTKAKGRARSSSRDASTPSADGVRLQKLLADAGVASRRHSEELISAGRVRVNGHVVTKLGSHADPFSDHVEVDGRSVGEPAEPCYFMLHKPRGVITTTRDPRAKKTVLDLVPTNERIFPVGRLDAASEGLLLLTNHGALAHVLLHPSFEITRTYRASIDGAIRAATVRRLEGGVQLEGKMTAPCTIRVLTQQAERSVIELDLIEGRRRQIRLMLEAVGHRVRRLIRTRYGPLELGRLRYGESRPLKRGEINELRELMGSFHEH